jgi:hypothetical protein
VSWKYCTNNSVAYRINGTTLDISTNVRDLTLEDVKLALWESGCSFDQEAMNNTLQVTWDNTVFNCTVNAISLPVKNSVQINPIEGESPIQKLVIGLADLEELTERIRRDQVVADEVAAHGKMGCVISIVRLPMSGLVYKVLH